MINCKVGDILLRVVPPHYRSPGFSQAGTVTSVDDDTIAMVVQTDIPRTMTFHRTTGADRSGIGSYVVPQDLSLNQADIDLQRRTAAEYAAVLSDPIGIMLLINWHDLQQTRKEASDMPGGESNEARRKELYEMGRQLIIKEGDYALFPEDVLRQFGFANHIPRKIASERPYR